MTDLIAIRDAERVGYEIFWSMGAAYYRRVGSGADQVSEPFNTLDDAAYAALSDYEYVAALAREREIWTGES